MAGIPIGFQSSLVENIAMLWLQNKNPSLRRRRNLTSASDVCSADIRDFKIQRRGR